MMIGSITFSSNCPASAAKLTVASLPITLKQTWLVTSGITGFTLPGMIEEPGALGGRLISFKPQRGPSPSPEASPAEKVSSADNSLPQDKRSLTVTAKRNESSAKTKACAAN